VAAQLVRVTFELTIDDSERAVVHKEQLVDLVRHIDNLVATAPGTRVVRFEYRMPRRPVKVPS